MGDFKTMPLTSEDQLRADLERVKAECERWHSTVERDLLEYQTLEAHADQVREENARLTAALAASEERERGMPKGERWGVWCIETNHWDSVTFRCVLDESTAMYLAACYTAPDVPHRPHYEARALSTSPAPAPSAEHPQTRDARDMGAIDTAFRVLHEAMLAGGYSASRIVERLREEGIANASVSLLHGCGLQDIANALCVDHAPSAEPPAEELTAEEWDDLLYVMQFLDKPKMTTATYEKSKRLKERIRALAEKARR